MICKRYDAVVIGAGPAGLAAAAAMKKAGAGAVLVLDREEAPGGILNQCIHNGFGIHRYGEELTGPEYAGRCLAEAMACDVELLLDTCVVDIIPGKDERRVVALSGKEGLIEFSCRAVILAMGCRERNRGNIAIPGSRPAGVMTAGFAQRMINLHGYMPGREIVILGSGDIGLIMARRLSLEGAEVKAVVEIQPHPGGLNRNIVQCLEDFDIPLHLSHTVTEIRGAGRIDSVEVAPVGHSSVPDLSRKFVIGCDTLLLSIGLIPENELSIRAGVRLDESTRGPAVDSDFMTSAEGIFACGNVLHVHDIADWVSMEAECCGRSAAEYVRGGLTGRSKIPVRAGAMLGYVLPSSAEPGRPAVISTRPIAPLEDASLCIKAGGELIYSRRHRRLFPSIMQRIELEKVPEGAGCLEVFVKLKPE